MSREPLFHQPLPGTFEEVLRAIADEHTPKRKYIAAKPFLKWVGGKRSILPELLARMPDHYDTYHELFLGGGALFFAVQPQKAYLSDINFHLVITFRAIKNDVERVIYHLKKHAENHNKDYYLKARELLFVEKDETKIAALFIYLNKTCYNGLYRVNKLGKFNVPIGSYKEPSIVDEQNLRNCSLVLQADDIEQQTFKQVRPSKNGFYYLDPPYHQTYDGYANTGFGDEQHKELAYFCHKIDAKGGKFMLSNSDTPFVRELYARYTIEEVMAARSVSCKANQRNKENELIIRNYTTNR